MKFLADIPLVEWRPRSGDRIVGTIVGREMLRDRAGRQNVRLLVKTAAGSTLRGRELLVGEELSVLCAAVNLRHWARRADPKVGDSVSITYVGRHNAGANRIHRFDIDHQKRSEFPERLLGPRPSSLPPPAPARGRA